MPSKESATPPLVRFWRRVEITDRCWLWRGSLNNRGYGTMTVGSSTDGTERTVGAHRFSYEVHKGPVPSGLEMHHTCFVRNCVNPAHLEAVTRSENLRRKSPEYVHPNRRVSVCPQNHPYDEANTYINRGRRTCRECTRAANRRWWRETRDKPSTA